MTKKERTVMYWMHGTKQKTRKLSERKPKLLQNDKPKLMPKRRQTRRARLSASQNRRPSEQEGWQKTVMRAARKMKQLSGSDFVVLSKSPI
jgi:hypothetical protein